MRGGNGNSSGNRNNNISDGNDGYLAAFAYGDAYYHPSYDHHVLVRRECFDPY